MKKLYISILIILYAITIKAQTFEFSISFVGTNPSTNNYQFALIATPSASITDGNTADMGAGFYIPSGLTIDNFVMGNSNLPETEWSSETLGASNTNGDPYFVSRTEAGSSSILLNGIGPFELVLFDIVANPNPTSGDITFVENGDSVFNEILFVENYMNINLGSGTVNAYSQNDPSANSFPFDSLSQNEFSDIENKITVFPNPTKDIVTIETNLNLIDVKIFNTTGKLIHTYYDNTFHIRMLNSGMYILKINLEGTTISKRLIKE